MLARTNRRARLARAPRWRSPDNGGQPGAERVVHVRTGRAPGQHAVQPHHDDDLSIAAKGRRFIDDVAGYLAWVEQNPDGSVLNTYRTPTAGYLKLHRATCRTINDRPARRYR